MSGQQIGTVVGGLVGAYFGYPQLGAFVGGYIGGVIDPTVIKGPSIGDAQQQTSQGGMPIPKCFGHCPPIAPTLIDGDKLARKVKIKSGGKGSTTVNEQEGWRATRAFLVCEGPALIGRITRNGKLVYSAIAGDNIDSDSAKFASQITIYTGSETQGPDPSLEAIHGVGNTPYYPGRCYFVVRNDDETQTGGAANQYRIEIIGSGTATTSCSPDAPWVSGDTGNAQSIFDTAINGTTAFTAGWNNNLRRTVNGGTSWEGIDFATTTGWASSTTILAVWHENTLDSPTGTWYIAKTDAVAVSLDNGSTFTPYLTPVHTIYGGDAIGSRGGVWEVGGVRWAGAAETTNTVIFQPLILGSSDIDLGADYGRPSAIGDFAGVPLIGTSTGKIVTTTGTVLYDSGGLGISQFAFGLGMQVAVLQSGGYVTSTDGFGTYVLHSTGTVHGIVFAGGAFYRKTTTTIDSTLDPADPSSWVLVSDALASLEGGSGMLRTDGTAILASTQAEFVAVTPQVYALPDLVGAFMDVLGNTYGVCAPRVTADAAQWKDIVAEIALRASPLLPAHLDIDTMTDTVPGFMLGNTTLTGTDYVRTLCTYYTVDLPEYDDKLHAIRRGGAVVTTFNEDDLLAVEDEDNDVRSPALQTIQRLTVMYPDPANKYVATPQVAPRTSPDITTTNQVTIQCPIPFDADTMAQKTDILQKIAFLQLEGTFKRAFPAEYSKNVPSDPILFRGRRYCLTKASNDDCMVTFEGTYDRPSAYTSTAVGSVAPPPEPPSSSVKGPTIFAAMNLPSLRSADDVPGMYIAICGLVDGYAGCDLYLSIDGGESYFLAKTLLTESTMGRLESACDSGATDLITASVLHGHQLSSVTDAQITARANAFAIMSAGVAEIGQFKTATETATAGTYDLTALVRGLPGTTAAAHAIYDQFVMLDENVFFLKLDISLAGKTLYFQPVSRGTAQANNAIYPVVFDPQFTAASTVAFYSNAAGEKYTDASGVFYYEET